MAIHFKPPADADRMAGLRRICKAIGGMTVSDGGRTIRYVWDYAADEPVDERDMPVGSERWKISEQTKWARSLTP